MSREITGSSLESDGDNRTWDEKVSGDQPWGRSDDDWDAETEARNEAAAAAEPAEREAAVQVSVG